MPVEVAAAVQHVGAVAAPEEVGPVVAREIVPVLGADDVLDPGEAVALGVAAPADAVVAVRSASGALEIGVTRRTG